MCRHAGDFARIGGPWRASAPFCVETPGTRDMKARYISVLALALVVAAATSTAPSMAYAAGGGDDGGGGGGGGAEELVPENLEPDR